MPDKNSDEPDYLHAPEKPCDIFVLSTVVNSRTLGTDWWIRMDLLWHVVARGLLATVHLIDSTFT